MQRIIERAKRGNAQSMKDDEATWVDELRNRRHLESLSQTVKELREKIIPPLEAQQETESAQLESVQTEVEEVRCVFLSSRSLADYGIGQAASAKGQTCRSRSPNPQERRYSRHPDFGGD